MIPSNRDIRKAVPLTCLLLILLLHPVAALAEDFTDAIYAFLQHRVEVEAKDVGVVVGIVDDHGSHVISYGKSDRGTGQDVNGDTVFEIGSITKTFTALLLQDMVERGEMRLDDPVARYLPQSVKVPSRNDKDITLLQLATHTSGLPTTSVTWIPKRADDPRAEYTIARMYDFVSGYKLTRDPGTEYEYSTVGMALLGQAIALKAGTDYESWVVDRICRPLRMDSTGITLTPELKARLADGHNHCGYTVASSYWGALTAGAALHSTANDLLKYVSANLGLTPSRLTPLMEKTHVARFHAHLNTDTGVDTDLGLAWMITRDIRGYQIIQHGGLSDGFIAFVGCDLTRRRGVVVLSNLQDFDVPTIAYLILESEWQSDRRPTEASISHEGLNTYVGQYRQDRGVDESAQTIGVYRDGNRVFVHANRPRSWWVEALLPPVTVELLPVSEHRFFERLSGWTVTFSRDDAGKVTGLTVYDQGREITYHKLSNQPPQIPKPSKPLVAIKLAANLLDACVGHYEFAADSAHPAGMKLTVWREGDQLVGQAWGRDTLQGAFDIYPKSDTNFFIKINGAQLTFIKDVAGQVMAVIYHSYRTRFPDCKGSKVSD